MIKPRNLSGLALVLIFCIIVANATDYDAKIGPLYQTGVFAVALNQLYVHCNHRDWQEIRITLTMNGDIPNPVLMKGVYIAYNDGRKRKLPVPEFEFAINSGDVVKELPITITGNIGLLNENKHGTVPYIYILLSYNGYDFWIKNSGPTW